MWVLIKIDTQSGCNTLFARLWFPVFRVIVVCIHYDKTIIGKLKPLPNTFDGIQSKNLAKELFSIPPQKKQQQKNKDYIEKRPCYGHFSIYSVCFCLDTFFGFIVADDILYFYSFKLFLLREKHNILWNKWIKIEWFLIHSKFLLFFRENKTWHLRIVC